MEITKSKDRATPNNYDWQGLSTGKLFMLAKLCKQHRKQDPIANDCYCAIRNAFYEYDEQSYKFIEKY